LQRSGENAGSPDRLDRDGAVRHAVRTVAGSLWAFCLLFGAIAAAAGFRYARPRRMTLTEFTEERPRRGRVRLTEARLLVAAATVTRFRDVPMRIFVPAVPADEGVNLARVMVCTGDPDVAETVGVIRRLESTRGPAEVTDWVRRNPHRTMMRRDIVGMVETEADLPPYTSGAIASNPHVSSNFLLVNEGATPWPPSMVPLLLLGSAGVGYAVWDRRRSGGPRRAGGGT
jgi:hypothetical protein